MLSMSQFKSIYIMYTLILFVVMVMSFYFYTKIVMFVLSLQMYSILYFTFSLLNFIVLYMFVI